VLATNTPDDRFDASPAIVGDELFLKGKTYLYCIAKPREKMDNIKKTADKSGRQLG